MIPNYNNKNLDLRYSLCYLSMDHSSLEEGYYAYGDYFSTIRDYQGSICVVLQTTQNSFGNEVLEHNRYDPWGVEFGMASNVLGVQPFKHQGKERIEFDDYSAHDHGARMAHNAIGRWTVMDPLMEKYYPVSPDVYCGNNPVMFVDGDGEAWKPILSASGKYSGFQWISHELSFNESGDLKAGLYEQGILFTDLGTYDPDKRYNMGSATATVFKADGTTQDFDACVNPADPTIHATVPEGLYKAVPHEHQEKYDALQLKMLNGSEKIELGMKHPSDPSRTWASGINIHKAGGGNTTGKTKSGQNVSEGCFLIDRNKWVPFMELFPNKNTNPIGVILYKYDPVEDERQRKKKEKEEKKKTGIREFIYLVPYSSED